MTSQVSLYAASLPFCCIHAYPYALQDGGWLKSNPIPSDKGSFGHFEEIALQNRRLLQQILSEDASSHFSSVSALMSDPYDEILLKKVRGLYDSCMDEDHLNDLGEAPLKDMTKKIRELFRGKTTIVDAESSASEEERDRLTATVAYLHSRGKPNDIMSEMHSPHASFRYRRPVRLLY